MSVFHGDTLQQSTALTQNRPSTFMTFSNHSSSSADRVPQSINATITHSLETCLKHQLFFSRVVSKQLRESSCETTLSCVAILIRMNPSYAVRKHRYKQRENTAIRSMRTPPYTARKHRHTQHENTAIRSMKTPPYTARKHRHA
jgi:hypothetical protein